MYVRHSDNINTFLRLKLIQLEEYLKKKYTHTHTHTQFNV